MIDCWSILPVDILQQAADDLISKQSVTQLIFPRWNNVNYGYFQHVEEVDCYPNICDYGIGWKKFFNVAVVGEPIWDFELYNFSGKVKHFAKIMHWQEIISWDWILMSSSTTASHRKLFEETFKVII